MSITIYSMVKLEKYISKKDRQKYLTEKESFVTRQQAPKIAEPFQNYKNIPFIPPNKVKPLILIFM